MGVALYVLELCGWEVNFKELTKDVKKFNPDTGEPYFIKKIDKKQLLIGNKVIIEENEFHHYEEYNGLQFILPFEESEKGYLGIVKHRSGNLMYLEYGYGFEVNHATVHKNLQKSKFWQIFMFKN